VEIIKLLGFSFHFAILLVFAYILAFVVDFVVKINQLETYSSYYTMQNQELLFHLEVTPLTSHKAILIEAIIILSILLEFIVH